MAKTYQLTPGRKLANTLMRALLAFRLGYSTPEGLRSPRRAVDEVVKL